MLGFIPHSMSTHLFLAATIVSLASALPGLAAREACSPQSAGAGPATTPDTADAFLANSIYTDTAASAPIPQGYARAFTNLTGSTSHDGYMGS